MSKKVSDVIKDLRSSLAIINEVNSPRPVHITIPAEDARALYDTVMLVPKEIRECNHPERFKQYTRTSSFRCSKCGRTIKENW